MSSKKKGKPLTAARQHFCREYCGNGHNATQAYKTAFPNSNGGWDKLGPRLMGKDGIREEITRLETHAVEENSLKIKTRLQRQAFWSDMMDETDASRMDKLRASELLGKSQADFIDVHLTKADDATAPLSPEQRTAAMAAAKAATGPKLSKEAV